jgi:hypothetical protein
MDLKTIKAAIVGLLLLTQFTRACKPSVVTHNESYLTVFYNSDYISINDVSVMTTTAKTSAVQVTSRMGGEKEEDVNGIISSALICSLCG